MVGVTDFSRGGEPDDDTERLRLSEITQSLHANLNFDLAASGTIENHFFI